MNRIRLLNIANFLIAFLLVAAAALVVSDMLANRLARRFNRIQPDKQKTVVQSSAPEDLQSFSIILTSGLFGNASKGMLTPVVRQSQQASAPAVAPSDLMLLGTVIGTFRETFALVRSNGKQEERVFRLGDTVFDAGKLVEVTKEKAFILISGKKVELLTPLMPPTASKPADATSTVSPGGGVSHMGGGSYVIDQRALNAALDNIGQAMSDARLLPSQNNGRVEGFRASEVKPGGVFAMVGIKNGDILVKLNDFPIDAPDKALQSFISLKGQNRLKLDLIRDGQPLTLNYDIR